MGASGPSRSGGGWHAATPGHSDGGGYSSLEHRARSLKFTAPFTLLRTCHPIPCAVDFQSTVYTEQKTWRDMVPRVRGRFP